MLAHPWGKMPADRLLLGSDSPLPLGELGVGSPVRDSGMAEQAKTRLLGANGARIFRL